MGKESKSLKADEIRRLLKLVHELHPLPTGGEGRRERMIRELCLLTGAAGGESAVVRADGTDVQLLSSVAVGSDGRSRGGLLVARIDGRDVTDPALLRLLATARGRRGSVDTTVTKVRRDLVDDRAWYRSPFVTEFRHRVGLDDGVYSIRPAGPGRVAVICLARPWGSTKAMGDYESLITQLLHSETGWVYDEPPGQGDLSPRQRDCLQRLLKGTSERQIATDLGLSPHTVHVHVKALYREMGVSTRAELMARFIPPSMRVRRMRVLVGAGV